ncbi:MAG: hypothetical protein COA38_20265 [Fluviicola sp.]|nr:MAG: hypothetical protein COA38_20265 [Fluviicola sp.]
MKIYIPITPNYFVRVIFVLIFSLFSTTSFSQTLVNPDLDGVISGLYSLPYSWESVPYDDPICLANAPISATPDLASLTAPNLSIGISGNPYSGNTFVCGLLKSNINYVYHEGIMQTVNCLTVGQVYDVSFYQANVKQLGTNIDSARWSVYIDSTLIGITAPTYSGENWDSNSFPWEYRTVNFTATSTSHTLKFLPYFSPFPSNFGWHLRAGIDSISMTSQNGNFTSSISESACDYYESPSGNYTWTESGTYYDTLIGSQGCDSIIEINLTINNVDTGISQIDNVTLQADAFEVQYQWLNCDSNYVMVAGFNNQSATFSQNGNYAVQISQFGCTDTSDCITISSVGINESSFNKLEVYPNPVINNLNIQFDYSFGEIEIELIDLMGQSILTRSYFDENKLNLSMSHLSSGNYILILRSNEYLARIKIMKE